MSKKKEEKIEELKEEQCTCNCDNECNCDDECTCGCNCECSDTELNQKINNLQEALLRNQAELMNYKRRKDEEMTRMLKYAEEDIIMEFLPILDNFERAIKMDDNDLSDEVSKFLEGFKMIYGQINNLLTKFEVSEIEALDKEFDATYHQAVITGKDETKESGINLEVLQKGYMYKDKVIRPSMVKVNE